ncbi:MAG: hypothetical protein RRA94_10220 [Bacteroidota bacterium]|nr:hypothetical protein [Bacteroidota bacterium]
MRFFIFSLFLFLAASITAFAQAEGAVSEAGDVYSDSQAIEITEEYELYGEPMPDVEEKFRLGAAVSQFQNYIGAEMQISGTVAGMCGGEECYFTMKDGGSTAKVVLIDPGAPMPQDISGREVTVLGMLEATDTEGNPQMEPSDDGQAPKHFRILTRSIRVMR